MREGEGVASPWDPAEAQARGAGGGSLDSWGRPLSAEPRKMAERGVRLSRAGEGRGWPCALVLQF